MLRIALTGGIATGKSHVLDWFREHGVPVLDADVLAHGVIAPGTEAAAAIAARFGAEIITGDGSVDRKKLGRIVFDDPHARRDLEAIIHPSVYRAITAGLRAFELMGDSAFAIADVPLLYETGHAADFDRVIVTTCSPAAQRQRLIDRGMAPEEAERRIAAQWPTDQKASKADFVIRTDGSFDATHRQIEAIVHELQK
jgi:dephospho-CoA kinase